MLARMAILLLCKDKLGRGEHAQYRRHLN